MGGGYGQRKIPVDKRFYIFVFPISRNGCSKLHFFAILYLIIFFSLIYLKNSFYPGAIPWADAFASATAYVGMWLMAKKKVESWYWWIATNIASIPLYFVKDYELTSYYYIVLLILAVFGLIEWKKKGGVSSKLKV